MAIALERACDKIKFGVIAGSIGEQSYKRMLVEHLRQYFQKSDN